jgi:hypothetical protein
VTNAEKEMREALAAAHLAVAWQFPENFSKDKAVNYPLFAQLEVQLAAGYLAGRGGRADA